VPGLSEPGVRRFGVFLVALVLLKFGADLVFGIGFDAIAILLVIAQYLALLIAIYYAVEKLTKNGDRRTVIFIVCALALATTAYTHLTFLTQSMKHLSTKHFPP
jgi:hypothetical protein